MVVFRKGFFQEFSAEDFVDQQSRDIALTSCGFCPPIPAGPRRPRGSHCRGHTILFELHTNPLNRWRTLAWSDFVATHGVDVAPPR